MTSYMRGTLVSPEQVAQYAYQAGFRGEDLAHIVGLATQRESGNETSNYHSYAAAHRTSTNNYDARSGDFGITQINWGAWGQQLVDAGIIRTHTDLYDPATNLKAAKYVLDKQGWGAWAAASGGFNAGGDSWYGVNRSAAEAAVAKAQTNGLVGADAGTGTSATGTPTVGLPRDARLVEVPGVARYAMFQVQPGVWIRYAITANSGINTAGRYFTKLTSAEWAKTFGNSVQGGDAAELADIPTAFGTYKGYLDAILDQVFPKGDPRRNDPEIMRVLATRAGRPDMTEAEFENLLKGTQYYQSRTEGQLRWNDLSEAERQVQREDMKSRMNQAWMSHVGSNMPSGPAYDRYIDDLASGKMGFGSWTETILKPAALQTPESPWARQVRDEQEAQLQRPIDIENTMLRVRETLGQWGLQWSDSALKWWATAITTNTKSDDDLMNTVKQQSQVLFPWKDADMETQVAAAPWIETYNRVLERQGSLRTPEIVRALAAYGRDPDNNDPWSFEQKLKMTDAYDQTKQGADDAYSTVGELAGMMGF